VRAQITNLAKGGFKTRCRVQLEEFSSNSIVTH